MRHPEEDCPAIKVKQKTVKLDAILLKGASDPEIQSLSIGSTLYIGFVFFFYELRKKSALTCSRQRKDTFYIGLGIGIHNFLAHCKQNENQSNLKWATIPPCAATELGDSGSSARWESKLAGRKNPH